jgi:HEPN domain-containing protein
MVIEKVFFKGKDNGDFCFFEKKVYICTDKMNKEDYITYWQTTALKDWEAVQHLFEKGDYLHALFFAHLVIEKLLKAHFVKDNQSDFPPRTHNLLVLSEHTQLELSDEQLRLLSTINQFQLDGRYPDYQLNMYRIASEEYTQDLLQKIDIQKIWLLQQLNNPL